MVYPVLVIQNKNMFYFQTFCRVKNWIYCGSHLGGRTENLQRIYTKVILLHEDVVSVHSFWPERQKTSPKTSLGKSVTKPQVKFLLSLSRTDGFNLTMLGERKRPLLCISPRIPRRILVTVVMGVSTCLYRSPAVRDAVTCPPSS